MGIGYGSVWYVQPVELEGTGRIVEYEVLTEEDALVTGFYVEDYESRETAREAAVAFIRWHGATVGDDGREDGPTQ